MEERTSLSVFEVATSKSVHTVKINAHFSMIDAKMRGLCTGLGGAYCLLCTIPSDYACGRVDDF